MKLREGFAGSAETSENPGILPNSGKFNSTSDRELRKEKKKKERNEDGKTVEKRRKDRKEAMESGKEEGGRTIGTASETASLERKAEPGSFKFHFVLPPRCMCAHS